MKIAPLGDSALTIELGNSISPDISARAIAIADHLDANRFPGLIECVPAYASVAVFYDASEVRAAFPIHGTAFNAVREIASKIDPANADESGELTRTIEIPVDFGPEAALDLEHVAMRSGLEPKNVVEIFLSGTYRVYMLGFLPGFAYMGSVDDRIATPRRETPRKAVPKGSVGIAGVQTGVYPLESPGGWQIIGRTPIEIFVRDSDTPCLFTPGDDVRFTRLNS